MSVGSSGAGPKRRVAGALERGAKTMGFIEKVGEIMLWTVFVILAVLWLLGTVTAYTMGGLVHVLLVIAVVALILQLVSGRRIA
jgi:hypothetical protein